jgi:hypothetical protein
VKPRSRPLAVAIAVLALLAAPSAASAAVVNNGDFETGNFAGWHEDYIGPDVGSWFVYTGTSSPIEEFPIPAPPQGTHAAIADQDEVSRQILYQDLTLPPGGSVYQLSLFAYYTGDGLGGSAGPFISPDTLSLGPDNEQYRIDLMKPSSPVDSVSSGDVLRNLLRTTDTSPDPLVPTMLTADLSPFAGQTVRIRLAVAVTEHTLNAGVDAVSVKSNGFSVGAATRNKKKGTAQVPLTLPDAGDVTVSGNGVKGRVASASKSVAVGAGPVNVVIKAKGKKKRKLNETGKVKVNASITYTPNGLPATTQQLKLKLKKKLKKG